MDCEHLNSDEAGAWQSSGTPAPDAQLVLYFAARDTLGRRRVDSELAARFPKAHIVGCSTGGQITDDVSDGGVHAVALRFARTAVRVASAAVSDCADSFVCGTRLGLELKSEDLAGVFVLSDGLMVNGSRLAAGLSSAVGPGVPVSGGLAGDGAAFTETWVGVDGPAVSGRIVAVGLYGQHLRLGHGSAGGWDVFGPRRLVTRATDNVLHELDGQPALDLYERYLGPDEAALLPGSALLFPLMLRDPEASDRDVVRTVLGVDRVARTMTFAGDIPEGWTVQLMRGHFDRLTNAAMEAARSASPGLDTADGDSLAVLVSCIGRRLLMGQRISDEIEAAQRGLAPGTRMLGFYSYGEIAPHGASRTPQLHNQTMTVTMMHEIAA